MTSLQARRLMMNEEDVDRVCHFKLVLLGQGKVGKSSLVQRFVNGKFKECYEQTRGAAFFKKTINLDSATVNFEIWDTAGQERYHSIAPMYYRGADAALVVYDITDEESFAKAHMWVKELQKYGKSDAVVAVAGNKSDMTEIRAVKNKEAKAFAESKELIFFETSAKHSTNVDEIFQEIAKKLLASRSDERKTPAPSHILQLDDSSPPQKSSCCS